MPLLPAPPLPLMPHPLPAPACLPPLPCILINACNWTQFEAFNEEQCPWLASQTRKGSGSEQLQEASSAFATLCMASLGCLLLSPSLCWGCKLPAATSTVRQRLRGPVENEGSATDGVSGHCCCSSRATPLSWWLVIDVGGCCSGQVVCWSAHTPT